jgi:hypothetical protein
MTAQPIAPNGGASRTHLPRTIKAIRAALPTDRRTEFLAELDDVEAGGLAVVVTKWWTRAVVWSDPATMAELESVRAGTSHSVPIEDVLGAGWRG